MTSVVDRVDQSIQTLTPVPSTSTAPPPLPAQAAAAALNPSRDALPSSSDQSATVKKKPKQHHKPRIVLSGTPDEILSRNSERAASPAFVEKLVQRAGTHWNKFYSNHAKNPNPFFKDRHWTDREWPQLAQLGEVDEVDADADSPEEQEEGQADQEQQRRARKGKGKAVLEVGCGTGAFIYPLLERYPQARYVAFDFAKKAVELTMSHPLYTPSSCHIFQHDLTLPLPLLAEKLASTPPEFGEPILPGSFDVVSCVFVLSALPPNKQAEAVKTLVSLLAPGGWLLFRDYALRDAAQLRFHSLPSASYATEPSLLSPRVATPSPSSSGTSSPIEGSSDAPEQQQKEDENPPTTTTAATTAVQANLPFYRRGDNTLTYFFTPEEITTFVSSAVSSLGSNEVELEGGVEVVEREMENRKEGWGCTRRFVHGSWRRVK
ncbi:hypothetical protein JCM10908_005759 [Rhodotorula pacifica]|uniref:class I SAM-dependent methyltransferase n=1 Tax=Rhodotorula pacifica TaxID=1495444 RepID=UPI00317A9E50